ncbi:hypothetical protein BGX38DRAFT_1288730 [Terfezia claveryi]|nr:hypothetical protein BGX38DRAFT_1288730 [Terfezia claveryi]
MLKAVTEKSITMQCTNPPRSGASIPSSSGGSLPVKKYHNGAGGFAKSPVTPQEPTCAQNPPHSHNLYDICHGSLAGDPMNYNCLCRWYVLRGCFGWSGFFPAFAARRSAAGFLVVGGAATGASSSSSYPDRFSYMSNLSFITTSCSISNSVCTATSTTSTSTCWSVWEAEVTVSTGSAFPFDCHFFRSATNSFLDFSPTSFSAHSFQFPSQICNCCPTISSRSTSLFFSSVTSFSSCFTSSHSFRASLHGYRGKRLLAL